jgi:hypothetical protein
MATQDDEDLEDWLRGLRRSGQGAQHAEVEALR